MIKGAPTDNVPRATGEQMKDACQCLLDVGSDKTVDVTMLNYNCQWKLLLLQQTVQLKTNCRWWKTHCTCH